MKKLLILISMISVCLLSFSGCAMTMNNVTREPNFSGVVVETHDSYVLVDSEESGLITVSKNTTLKDGSPELTRGDIVTVFYDGNIMETYPAQLSEVYAIVITGHDDGKIYDSIVGLYMAIESNDGKSAKVTLVNETYKVYCSGNEHDFGLEVYDHEKGDWVDYPTLEGEFMNTSEAWIFEPGSREMNFKYDYRYGELPTGEYRFVKAFWPDDSGIDDTVYVTAGFKVE